MSDDQILSLASCFENLSAETPSDSDWTLDRLLAMLPHTYEPPFFDERNCTNQNQDCYAFLSVTPAELLDLAKEWGQNVPVVKNLSIHVSGPPYPVWNPCGWLKSTIVHLFCELHHAFEALPYTIPITHLSDIGQLKEWMENGIPPDSILKLCPSIRDFKVETYLDLSLPVQDNVVNRLFCNLLCLLWTNVEYLAIRIHLAGKWPSNTTLPLNYSPTCVLSAHQMGFVESSVESLLSTVPSLKQITVQVDHQWEEAGLPGKPVVVDDLLYGKYTNSEGKLQVSKLEATSYKSLDFYNDDRLWELCHLPGSRI